MVGTRAGTLLTSLLLVAIPLTAQVASTPTKGIPFDQVEVGTSYVIFYRIEGRHQFLFVYHMPEKRLVALEIDQREDDPSSEPGSEEAGEVVHHLPISKLSGRIQYLGLARLPVSRPQLLKLTGHKKVVFQGILLEASEASKDHWLGLNPLVVGLQTNKQGE